MTQPPPDSPAPRRRRRALALALLPAFAGVAYALAVTLGSGTPPLLETAPSDAAWVERWRNLSVLAVFGAMREPALPDGKRPDAFDYVRALGERVNVPDLVGVNPEAAVLRWRQEPYGPFPREGFTLPLDDAGRFEKRFREHGIDLTTPRHAMWLRVRGDLASITTTPPDASDPGARFELPSEGEDLAVVADVPRLVALALAEMGSGTYDALLAGLGVTRTDPAALAADPTLPPIQGIERLARIPAAWQTARYWFHIGDQQTLPSAHVELRLADGPFAAAWRKLVAGVGERFEWTPPPDPDLRLWASLSGGTAPDLLRLAAWSVGAHVPELDALAPEELGRTAGAWPASGWVMMRAQGRERSALATAAHGGEPPTPRWFHLDAEGDSEVRRTPGPWHVVAGGEEGDRAAARLGAHLVTGGGTRDTERPEEAERPGRRLLRAVLRRSAAWDVIGPTLLTGGALLAPFDGRPLVLDVRATEDALLVFIHVHDS